MSTDILKASTQALVQQQRTMVLSTCSDNEPWTAPVYYVHHAGAFFFFSSPRSQHAKHAMSNPHCAAAIFSDSDNWKQIRGLQMTGHVLLTEKLSEQIRVTGRFLLKFPFAKAFLQGGDLSVPDLKDKIRLYQFVPKSAFILDNAAAFGKRTPIDPTSF